MIARNSVILIDQIEAEQARGRGILGRGRRGHAASRFRPIMLTAVSTVLGMIPIAPTVFWGPMAYAIMGGLAVATLLTLCSFRRSTSPGSASRSRPTPGVKETRRLPRRPESRARYRFSPCAGVSGGPAGNSPGRYGGSRPAGISASKAAPAMMRSPILSARSRASLVDAHRLGHLLGCRGRALL